MYEWTPYVSRGARLRVQETSCCGRYELAGEGGQYVVLRPAENGHEETARGVYADAARAYADLRSRHRCSTKAKL